MMEKMSNLEDQQEKLSQLEDQIAMESLDKHLKMITQLPNGLKNQVSNKADKIYANAKLCSYMLSFPGLLNKIILQT